MSAGLSSQATVPDNAMPDDGRAVAVMMTEAECGGIARTLTEVVGLIQQGGGSDNDRGCKMLRTLREHRDLMARAARGDA